MNLATAAHWQDPEKRDRILFVLRVPLHLPKVTEALRQSYDLNKHSDYSPLWMQGWQYKAAFVIQFRPESDIEHGRFVGKIEHMTSHESTRFHSLDELVDFIARMLTEVRNTEQP